VTFLPERFTEFTNALKLHEKTNSFPIYSVAGNFSWNNFADFGFFGFRGKKKSRIWISDFTRGNNFSRNSCAIFESNKYGSHMVVFVTLFVTNFTEVQQ